ncbi:hypothetical protein V6N13_018958 [Hibiscus sabdariffa]|uniref:Uncharacterized protein n=1 Tax=Hibiscus sabdariffa TaxID=183260 RepID=A0ABR2EKB7_9ROSI
MVSSKPIDDNVVVRIYGIPSILIDNNDIVHRTGDSLGAMTGKVIKVDTCRIDLNMVDYLCVVTDAESTNAPTTPVEGNITGKMVAVTESQLMATTAPIGTIYAKDSKVDATTFSLPMHETIVNNNTHPMDPKLAAATLVLEPKVANANTPFANGVLSKDPTTPVATNTNVPMILTLKSQSTSPFGSTMVPTTDSFGESEGFMDFLANPTETNNEVPYLFDNMGLEATTTTILPIPREGELENDMVSPSLQHYLC